MKLNSSLLTLLASVTVAATFTACTNGDGLENEAPQVKTVNYAPAKTSKIFVTSGNYSIATYGSKNSVAAYGSRGCDSNTNLYTDMPDYPSEEEKAEVMAYIASKPEGVAWPGYTRYYVQQIGGAHHTYTYTDYNDATQSVDGTQAMEELTIIEANGDTVHVNDFNGGKYNNAASHDCMLMTNGFQSAWAINESMSSTIVMWKLFYFKGNYYLGLDYHGKKDAGSIEPDGCYDDWVLKIIPSTTTPTDPDPGVEPEPEPEPMVEVNLALNEEKEKDDYVSSKLSIHVRDTTDLEINIPIPADLYCAADDMYIIKNHDLGNYVYNETVDSVNMVIAGQTVTLKCEFKQNCITVTTKGINAEVLKELRTQYGDGINFEIWNYYDPKTNRATVQSLLNQSTIKFTDPITNYLNTINNDGTYTLDCTVTRVN